MGMRDGIRTENKQGFCDADYHSVISGKNKVRHVFQQLMGVIEEERKMTNGRVSVRLNGRN